MTRAAWVLIVVAACSRARTSTPAESSSAAVTVDGGGDPAEAARRDDCERVLDHTWKLMGGEPDHEKTRGPKRERDLRECVAHITPATTACVLAATTAAALAPCEALGK